MKITIVRILLFVSIYFATMAILSAQELSEYQGFLQKKYYQDAIEIPKDKFTDLLSENKTAYKSWKKSRSTLGFGNVALIGEGVLLVIALRKNNQKMGDRAIASTQGKWVLFACLNEPIVVDVVTLLKFQKKDTFFDMIKMYELKT